MHGPWNGEPVDADCRQAAEDAAALRKPRAQRRHREPGVRLAPSAKPRVLVAANVLASLLQARAKTLGKTLEAADVEPLTWSMAELGGTYSAADYARSVTTIHAVGRIVARLPFAGFDILLTPTMCARPPWPLGVLSLSTRAIQTLISAINRSIGFTSLFNASGNPAASLPLHWTKGGLPWACRSWRRSGTNDDPSPGGANQAARPWKDRRPPLAA